MINPGTGLVIFLITGLGGVMTYSAFHYAEKAGPKLEAKDWLPMLPPYPPVPRFMYEKPELLAELRRRA